ncbi:hypothetical protein [Naasia sp. SYSU D00057]|uniref:hypothetical protein n=1 Tax=Naasia sp. SYSU D00057 TaxID=2817380 RepID=UPI001B315C89|nr:hypothetical protein [Naasia sp. SYSU D00057]
MPTIHRCAVCDRIYRARVDSRTCSASCRAVAHRTKRNAEILALIEAEQRAALTGDFAQLQALERRARDLLGDR